MSTAFKTLAEEILIEIAELDEDSPIPSTEVGFVNVSIYINTNRFGKLLTKDRISRHTTNGRRAARSTHLEYALDKYEFEDTKKKLEDAGFYSRKFENCEGYEVKYDFVKPFGFKN